MVGGVGQGIIQINMGDVWKGDNWLDASMTLLSSGSGSGGSGSGSGRAAILVEADVGDFGTKNVWEVRGYFGAFPSCGVYNEYKLPLAPFGPLAVSYNCSTFPLLDADGWPGTENLRKSEL